MSVIADLPDLRPSLLLDFANSRRVHPLIQCTRASTATCYEPDGRLRTVANNVPRIDFDPETGKCLGMLAEESRANLAYPSNMPTSTVPTTTGVMQANGATKITSGLAAPDGTLTGFSVEGADVPTNSTGANNVRILAAATAIGTYIVTFWVKSQAGVKVNVRESSSAAIFQFSPSVSWKRVSANFTTTAVNQNIILYSELGARFDVWGVQLEAGGFATSYIPTTAAAQTRAADMLSMIVPQLPSDGYTICVDASINWVGEYPVILSDNPTGLGNYVGIRVAAAGSYINSAEGGRSGTVSPRPASGAAFKMAAAISNDASKGLIAVDGILSAVTSARTAADFSLRNILKFGAWGGAAQGVNLVRRVAIYPRALTGAQLQRLTA